MKRTVIQSGSMLTRLSSAMFALGIAASGQAAAATKEVTLASPAEALTYCKSGKMPSGDIAYISGSGGLAQFGPDAKCVQQVPTKVKMKLAVQIAGTKVSECKLVTVTQGLAFCQSGAMGEYDIDYVAGKIGQTISGPGYGCVANFSSSGIGGAICK